MKGRQVLALLALLVLLSGCWIDVLRDPCNPRWDSLEVTGAYETQAAATLILLVAGAALLSGLVVILFGGFGGRW